MRIATGAYYNQLSRNLAQRQQDLAKAQEKMTTLSQVNRLGENPSVGRMVLQDESLLRRTKSYARGLDEADHVLKQTDSSLMDVSDAVQDVYELALRMSNDTYNADDRLAAQNEVGQLRERLVALGNTKIGGRYVFGGLGSGQPPFAADGSFQGDAGTLRIPIGDGQTIAAGLSGGSPFTDPAGGADGIFDLLNELDNALAANDSTQIRTAADRLQDVGVARVTRAEQETGNLMNRSSGARAALENVQDATTLALSETRDVDLVELTLRLTETTLAMQAALTATAQAQGLDLVSVLG